MNGVSYHPKTTSEVREFAEYYQAISLKLAREFRQELLAAISRASEFPERLHFDESGIRRANLKRFPVHFLFRVKPAASALSPSGITVVIPAMVSSGAEWVG